MRARRLAATVTAGAVLCLVVPVAIAGTPSTPAPAPTAVPTAVVTVAAEPTAVPTVEPTAEPTAVPTAEPSAAASPEPTPALVADPMALPGPAPAADPAGAHTQTGREAQEARIPVLGVILGKTAQSQVPPPPGCVVTGDQIDCGDERVCVVTSAGLKCFGGALCAVTSAAVTCLAGAPLCVLGTTGELSCSQDCVLTSAGLNCVLGSGETGGPPPIKPPPPTPPPPPSPTPVPPPDIDRRTAGATFAELPFTGAMVLPVMVAGWVLLGGGLLLRRRTRRGMSVASPLSGTPTQTRAPGPRTDRRVAGADGSERASSTAMVIAAFVVGWAVLAGGLLLRRLERRGRGA